jgi:hypothetical protein
MLVSAALTVALGIPAGWLGLALRRRIVALRAPGAFEAHLRVITGTVPHVPSYGMPGIAVVEDRRLTFLEARVRDLAVEGLAGEPRDLAGAEARRLYPHDVVLPLLLLGGTVVELAVARRDEDQVRAALGLLARDTA